MLLAAFLVSCDIILDYDGLLKEDQFYAVDFSEEVYYKVTAKKLAEGQKCVIWAENGSGISKAKAEEIAARYDNDIRPKILDSFGMKDFSYKTDGEEFHFDDILDFTNWLAGNNNGKLTILLLDIKDDFDYPKNQAYVAGYFSSNNFYQKEQEKYSNGCDMIYVDTDPGLNPNYNQEEQTYATFAHELQHLINYATTRVLGRKPMDTWIDEGLSSQAEHIYYGKNDEEKTKWFIKDENGTIAQGNNFFVWDNRGSKAILDEYSTVYLFFRWLSLQAGSDPAIFLDIEKSNSSDHNGITKVAGKIRSEWADWDTLLGAWLAANYYPANPVYGYKDSYFSILKVKPISNKTIKLYPGEGVYSNIRNHFTPSGSGPNIRYRGISSNSSIISTQISFNPGISNILLAFNANTNNSKSTAAEDATLTGVSAGIFSVSNSMTAVEDTQTETPAGPYVIDARDASNLLGRNK